MKLKAFTPLHGWRAFAGEVGVVVLGVLLALGAQQVVQEIQTRTDVRAFRQTIDHEIGLNLFMYDVRARQLQCVDKKVAELRLWLDQARSGIQVPAIYAGQPSTITPYRSAWDNRDAQVFNHLPAKLRAKYSEFYDELANNWTELQLEQQDWQKLWPYAEPGPISLQDRRAIRPVIAKLRSWNETLDANFAVSRKIAKEFNVRPVKPANFPHNFLDRIEDCPSIIAPSATPGEPPPRAIARPVEIRR